MRLRTRHAARMHLAHAAQAILHAVIQIPLRPLLAAAAVAGAVRLAARQRAAFAAGLGVFAGWMAMGVAGLFAWPLAPLHRLPGAALLLLAAVLLAGRTRPWLVRLGLCAAMSWWLSGAPVHGGDIAHCVPVFLGLLAGMAMAERLARPAAGDPGWSRIAAAAALAGALWVADASNHWAIAALVPAAASIALLGLADASALVARALTAVAAAAILASDRGRFLPVDAAAASPLAAYILAPRLTRLGPAGASLLAAAVCIAAVYMAVVWGARGVWTAR